MGESAEGWGQLAQYDDELAEVWDGFERMPERGSNAALDAFLDRKGIAVESLVRLGSRMADHNVIAFAFPGGVKFRDLITDRRWSYVGSTWPAMKVVQHGTEPAETIVICEGETDGAKLSEVYDVDVAVMPAGAGYFPQSYADQLTAYKLVLVGLDTDAAGERGAQKIIADVPHAVRFAPPANDWCDTEDFPPIPDAPELRVEMQTLVSAGDLLDLEPPPCISWYEHALLPVAGQMIIHGWAKSFKSFISMDILAALAQGQDWCCFEPTEEPCRVAAMQYEIPYAYYRQRVQMLLSNASYPDLFKANFLTWRPLQRPQFVAGNVPQEDFVLKTLEDHDIQVFCLDPIRRATGIGDLNSEKEVRPLLHFFQRCQDIGITVITCHHDNKTFARSGGGDPLGMTGAGSFSGDADTIVSISLPKGLTIEDPRRNMHFLMRNAPSVGARAMTMTESGAIVYSTSAHGPTNEPIEEDDGPPI